jgi:hypothetical protein
VNTLSLDDLADVSLRARWTRHRQVLIPIIVAVLIVGAFLEWGPIGLGNGPLYMGMSGAGFGKVSSRLPVGIVTPIMNSGSSALVIDRVQLLGNASYPAPHVLAVEAMSNTQCGYLFPVRTTAAGFVLAGCGGRPLGRLYGRAVGNLNSTNVFAAFKIEPPRAGACWLVTRIVTRYHVGIRHYVATNPYVLAACAGPIARAVHIADTAGG